MKGIYLLVSYAFLLFCPPASAEKVWTSFTPSDAVYDIALQGNYVWCATSNGPARWDKRDMSYRVYRGLYDNRVSTVEVDPDGNAWFGGLTGIQRWNGVSWERFSTSTGLPYNDVSALALDPNGRVWAGLCETNSSYITYVKSIVRYTDETWQQVLLIQPPTINDDDKLLPVRSLAILSPDDVWAIVGSQLWQYNGTEWSTIIPGSSAPPLQAYLMVVDSSSRIWVADQNHIYRLEDGVWTEMYSSDTKDITFLEAGPEGELLVSVRAQNRASVLRYTGTVWEPIPYGENNDFTINTLCCDSEGIIWAGTDKGLFRYDSRGCSRFVLSNRLPNGDISSLAVRASGELWAGTSQGALRFDGRTWKKYSTADGLPDSSLTAMAVTPDDTVWFISKHDVARFDGASGKIQRTNTGLPTDARIYSHLVDSSGDFLVQSNMDIFRFQGEQWSQFDLGILANQEFEAWTVDTSGNVWIGVPFSHWTIRSATREVTWMESIYLGYDRKISFIFPRPDKSLWVGVSVNSGTDNGPVWTAILYRVDATSVSLLSSYAGRIRTQAVAFGDDVWIGVGEYNSGYVGYVGGGLHRYDSKKKSAVLYTVNNGLLSNAIESLAVSADGTVWVGFYNGLTRYGEPLEDESINTLVSDDNPAPLSLLHNHPNPFNPSTTLSFTLPDPGRVLLAVYDITGRKVRTLVSESWRAGSHTVIWDGRDDAGNAVASGVYLSRLTAGKYTATGKMLLLK